VREERGREIEREGEREGERERREREREKNVFDLNMSICVSSFERQT